VTPRRGAAAAAAICFLLAGSAQAAPRRAMSLDQCADQYILALAPEAHLVVSPRADDPDAWLRAQARGRIQARPTLESALIRRPDVVVRYWGGDQRLVDRLEGSGARVVQLSDAADFEAVEANIREVAEALDRAPAGERLIAAMKAKVPLLPARPRPVVRAQYLTAGGFTAGPGTLIDAVLRAAGFANATTAPGFSPVRIERTVLTPPARFVLGFFDQARADWRGLGRHPSLSRAAKGRTVAALPASMLTCPAWFAVDAARLLADAR
jgi:iron complex transport system substrate-binding protein